MATKKKSKERFFVTDVDMCCVLDQDAELRDNDMVILNSETEAVKYANMYYEGEADSGLCYEEALHIYKLVPVAKVSKVPSKPVVERF